MTAEKLNTLFLEEPLNNDDCTFLRSIFLSATPNQRTVDITNYGIEKIQGYAVIFRILAGEIEEFQTIGVGKIFLGRR